MSLFLSYADWRYVEDGSKALGSFGIAYEAGYRCSSDAFWQMMPATPSEETPANCAEADASAGFVFEPHPDATSPGRSASGKGLTRIIFVSPYWRSAGRAVGPSHHRFALCDRFPDHRNTSCAAKQVSADCNSGAWQRPSQPNERWAGGVDRRVGAVEGSRVEQECS
jgi:hypothetical protein